MSCCLSSSRLKIKSFFGRHSRSMISTNFFPNEPVPPVTRTTCSDQFIKDASSKLSQRCVSREKTGWQNGRQSSAQSEQQVYRRQATDGLLGLSVRKHVR